MASDVVRPRCPSCSDLMPMNTGSSLCPECTAEHAQQTRDEEDGREPDYDAERPLTPLENFQRNDEHSKLL